jgi:hypothetical protein
MPFGCLTRRERSRSLLPRREWVRPGRRGGGSGSRRNDDAMTHKRWGCSSRFFEYVQDVRDDDRRFCLSFVLGDYTYKVLLIWRDEIR